MIKNKIKDFLPSIIAVLIALIIGGIIMITKGVNPFTAYIDMMRAAFYQPYPRSPLFSGLANTLFIATPLIFSALATMVAFKAGLFNIGMQGQMIAGGLAATFWAITFKILIKSPIKKGCCNKQHPKTDILRYILAKACENRTHPGRKRALHWF